MYQKAVAGLALPDELAYDGVTMVSELAANTLHTKDNLELDSTAQWPLSGAPELWIYLRRTGPEWELVCKVFDSMRGWRHGTQLAPGDASPQAVSGRGLQVVAGLSSGHWGHHLTRARLGGWKVPGKAVWFTQLVPAAHVPDRLRYARIGPCQAARRLETMLADRGLAGSLLRTEEPRAGISVLSIRRGLTVWCRSGMIWWRTRTGSERRVLTDLEDTTEQIVRTCEEMDSRLGSGSTGIDCPA